MIKPLETDPRAAAFFGRRKGKALRKRQADRLAGMLPVLGLDLAHPAPDRLQTLFSSSLKEIRLEIGFGGGEHLLRRARQEPHVGFIGVEPFVNGMAKVLSALAEAPLANIRLSDADAVAVLDWLPPMRVDRILLLYPDPWPKKRHWKRRFVGADNIARFARVLKPGGRFYFASDSESYVDWTLWHVRRHPAFRWVAEGPDDWRTAWPGWQSTRYEAKAIREGRKATYLTFARL